MAIDFMLEKWRDYMRGHGSNDMPRYALVSQGLYRAYERELLTTLRVMQLERPKDSLPVFKNAKVRQIGTQRKWTVVFTNDDVA